MLIRDINALSLKLLERIYRQSRHHQVRQRAHCLLLISQGIRVNELQDIFQVTRKTIYNWVERWDSEGIAGLYNKPGRGRKQIFNLEQQEQINIWVNQEPKNLSKVVQKIQQKWGIKASVQTIKRIITDK